MCGRFTQQISWRELRDLYMLSGQPPAVEVETRFNGAPTQDFAVCRLDSDGDRVISLLRWGLIPFWATDKSIGSRLINARAETVHSKPSFRNAFRSKRCLVPASGWFEWVRAGTKKQPFYICGAEGKPASFAAIWESWDKEGEPIETFSILTTTASTQLSNLHHRQPVVVSPLRFDEWLDPSSNINALQELVNDPNEGPYKYHAVSTRVNNVRNNSGDLLEPVSDPTMLGTQ